MQDAPSGGPPPTAPPAIQVRDLVVEYPKLRALKGVSFDLPPASVTALVGPNGAGKTTLMRCLVALDRPFSGQVLVGGQDTVQAPREVHRRVGYLSDSFGLYDELSVARCVQHAAAVHGLRGAALKARVEELVALVGMAPLMERRAGTLSRGERQRVGLAQALAHDPQVLILDEPASGLDPGARHQLATLLKSLRDAGKTIVVSSHILAELEDYSNWMLTLEGGELRGMVPVDAPQAQGLRLLQVELDGSAEAALAAVMALPGVQSAEAKGPSLLVVGLTGGLVEQADLLRAMVGAGLRVAALGQASAQMQSIYLSQLGQGAGHES